MTRINVIAVEDLSNEHLMAEYRELPRIFTHVRKHGIQKDRIPEQYTLGKGHVLFFTDKLDWLHARFCDISWELECERGFDTNGKLYTKILDDMRLAIGYHKRQLVEFFPTPEDKYLNMARLVKRSKFDSAKQEAAE